MTDHITKPETAPAPFWLLWTESEAFPATRYASSREAHQEAGRLAAKHQGHDFHVFRAESVTRFVVNTTVFME